MTDILSLRSYKVYFINRIPPLCYSENNHLHSENSFLICYSIPYLSSANSQGVLRKA